MKHFPLVALLALFSAPAMAYVGPGLGMGVIGTIFGVLAAIVLAVFGLFWYPLKRKFGKKKAAAIVSQPGSTVAAEEDTGQPDTIISTRPESAVDTHTHNHGANHPGARNEAHDPASANRTDNLIR